MIIKPPLGITPKKFWIEARIEELTKAVDRRLTAGRFDCVHEWIDEIEELTEWLTKINNEDK